MELAVKKFMPQSTVEDKLETTNNHTINVQSQIVLDALSEKFRLLYAMG